MALTPTQARRVYDTIGRRQDWQAFYEDATALRLVSHAELPTARSIFELGCGTGRLAENLLRRLPSAVRYRGVDLSPTMVDLATARVAAWPERAEAFLVDGSLPLPAEDASADRVLSAFVLDLLDPDYAHAVLGDLRRILAPDGLLCLASLTYGERWYERPVSRAWSGLWRVAPKLVGGCRPIAVREMLGAGWRIAHHSRVHRWGLVTEIVVARPE